MLLGYPNSFSERNVLPWSVLLPRLLAWFLRLVKPDSFGSLCFSRTLLVGTVRHSISGDTYQYHYFRKNILSKPSIIRTVLCLGYTYSLCCYVLVFCGYIYTSIRVPYRDVIGESCRRMMGWRRLNARDVVELSQVMGIPWIVGGFVSPARNVARRRRGSVVWRMLSARSWIYLSLNGVLGVSKSIHLMILLGTQTARMGFRVLVAYASGSDQRGALRLLKRCGIASSNGSSLTNKTGGVRAVGGHLTSTGNESVGLVLSGTRVGGRLTRSMADSSLATSTKPNSCNTQQCIRDRLWESFIQHRPLRALLSGIKGRRTKKQPESRSGRDARRWLASASVVTNAS